MTYMNYFYGQKKHPHLAGVCYKRIVFYPFKMSRLITTR
jgi:hypothetical protein